MVKKEQKNAKISNIGIAARPPIVTVLGHVDHGKTTLLDTIRKTNTTSKEHGGITQRIGAYQVEVSTKEGIKKITFIDTPGHAAFTGMRSRGASVADIAILVVSAVDGVMPQTKEAIQIIKEANIPIIVAANKIDIPEANIKRVKKQLADADLLVEEYGGDTVVVPISAKNGTGVPELLDMIILVAELKELKSTPTESTTGVIIESKRDSRRGVAATVIVKTGVLRVGDPLFAEGTKGKVRAMITNYGLQLREAVPGDAIEVLGFETMPPVGAIFTTSEKTLTDKRAVKEKGETMKETEMAIRLVLKADVAGTLEAVAALLPPDVEVVSEGVGDITESDVLFAKTTKAIIVGFGVNVLPAAAKLAEFERVMIKTYTIIYELADELAEVVEAIKQGKLEEVLGEGEVLAEFPFDREKVAGVRVKSGRLARGDTIRIERGEEEVGNARIKTIRQAKNEVNRVDAGQECGLLFTPILDFQVGDAIISYRK